MTHGAELEDRMVAAAARFRRLLIRPVPLTPTERLLDFSDPTLAHDDEPHRPTETEWQDLGRP